MTSGVLAIFIACAFFWFAVIYLLAALSDLYRRSKEKKAFIAAPFRLHRNKGLNWLFLWLLASPLIVGYLMLRQGKLGNELMAIYNGNGWAGIAKMLLVFYVISFFLLGPLMLHAWFPISRWLKPEVLESKKIRDWLVAAVGLLVLVFAAYVGFCAEPF